MQIFLKKGNFFLMPPFFPVSQTVAAARLRGPKDQRICYSFLRSIAYRQPLS